MKVFIVIVSIISGIGNLIAIYKFMEELNMKINLGWLFVITNVIFLFSTGYLVITYVRNLEKWLGRRSYKKEYSDLKGKIKLYIREELEKTNSIKDRA